MAGSASIPGASPASPSSSTKTLSDAEVQAKLAEVGEDLRKHVEGFRKEALKNGFAESGFSPSVDYDATPPQISALKENIESVRKALTDKKVDKQLVDNFCDNYLDYTFRELHEQTLSGNPPNVASWNAQIDATFNDFKSYLEAESTSLARTDAANQLQAQKNLMPAPGSNPILNPGPALAAKLRAAEDAKTQLDNEHDKEAKARDAYKDQAKQYREYSSLQGKTSRNEALCSVRMQNLDKEYGQASSDKTKKAIDAVRAAIKDRQQIYEDFRTNKPHPAPNDTDLDTKRQELVAAEQAWSAAKSSSTTRKITKLQYYNLLQKREELGILEDTKNLAQMAQLKDKKDATGKLIYPDLQTMQTKVDDFGKQLYLASQEVAANMTVAIEVIHRELVQNFKAGDPAVPALLVPPSIDGKMIKALEDKLRERMQKIYDDPETRKDAGKMQHLNSWGFDKLAGNNSAELLQKVEQFNQGFQAKDVDHWAGLLRVAQDVRDNVNVAPNALPDKQAQQLASLQPYLTQQVNRENKGYLQRDYKDKIETPFKSPNSRLELAQQAQIAAQKELGKAINTYKTELEAKRAGGSPADQALIDQKITAIGAIPTLDASNQQKVTVQKELDRLKGEAKRALLKQEENNLTALERQVTLANTILLRRKEGWHSDSWVAVGPKNAQRLGDGKLDAVSISGSSLPGVENKGFTRDSRVYSRAGSKYALSYEFDEKTGVHTVTPIEKGWFLRGLKRMGRSLFPGLAGLNPFYNSSRAEFKDVYKDSIDFLLDDPRVKTINVAAINPGELKSTESADRAMFFRCLQAQFAVCEEKLGIGSSLIRHRLGGMFSSAGGQTGDLTDPRFTVNHVTQLAELNKYMKEKPPWLDYDEYHHLLERLDRFPRAQPKSALGEGLKDTAAVPAAPPTNPASGVLSGGGDAVISADEEKKRAASISADEDEIMVDIPDDHRDPDDLEMKMGDDDAHPEEEIKYDDPAVRPADPADAGAGVDLAIDDEDEPAPVIRGLRGGM